MSTRERTANIRSIENELAMEPAGRNEPLRCSSNKLWWAAFSANVLESRFGTNIRDVWESSFWSHADVYRKSLGIRISLLDQSHGMTRWSQVHAMLLLLETRREYERKRARKQ